MSATTTQKPSLFKGLSVTSRDVRVFGLSALLFTSLAIGAISLTQPAHSQTASAEICSSDRFFR